MSEEKVEVVRRLNAAFGRRDMETLEKGYAPDIEWRDLQHPPDTPPVVHGIEAVKQIWAAWFEAFPDIRADVSEYIDAGDTVVCVVHWHGSGAGSGTPFDLDTVDALEVKGGRIVRATFGYRSKEEALEAAGLSE